MIYFKITFITIKVTTEEIDNLVSASCLLIFGINSWHEDHVRKDDFLTIRWSTIKNEHKDTFTLKIHPNINLGIFLYILLPQCKIILQLVIKHQRILIKKAENRCGPGWWKLFLTQYRNAQSTAQSRFNISLAKSSCVQEHCNIFVRSQLFQKTTALQGISPLSLWPQNPRLLNSFKSTSLWPKPTMESNEIDTTLSTEIHLAAYKFR